MVLTLKLVVTETTLYRESEEIYGMKTTGTISDLHDWRIEAESNIGTTIFLLIPSNTGILKGPKNPSVYTFVFNIVSHRGYLYTQFI